MNKFKVGDFVADGLGVVGQVRAIGVNNRAIGVNNMYAVQYVPKMEEGDNGLIMKKEESLFRTKLKDYPAWQFIEDILDDAVCPTLGNYFDILE